jgi:protein-S-isoprenylcysteine O-methyltransferase Ste14
MLGLYFICPGVNFIPIPWNLLGLLLLGTGVWISYAAEARFHRANITVQPFDEPTTLVTDGTYTLSRNPMYLGFASILLGVAILLRSLTPFLVIPVYLALIDIKFIRFEEQMLAKTFGRDWQEYVKKVRRWI